VWLGSEHGGDLHNHIRIEFHGLLFFLVYRPGNQHYHHDFTGYDRHQRGYGHAIFGFPFRRNKLGRYLEGE
jgi:hypothetical protein